MKNHEKIVEFFGNLLELHYFPYGDFVVLKFFILIHKDFEINSENLCSSPMVSLIKTVVPLSNPFRPR